MGSPSRTTSCRLTVHAIRRGNPESKGCRSCKGREREGERFSTRKCFLPSPASTKRAPLLDSNCSLPPTITILTATTSQDMVSDALDSNSPCNPHACAIQSCMQKTWDQSKCEHLIDDLYRCCAKFYNAKGPRAETESCPIQAVVYRRLKKMGEEDLLYQKLKKLGDEDLLNSSGKGKAS
jgi:hypothetical protein